MVIWVMGWLYPLFAAALTVLAILLALTYMLKDRQSVILWLSALVFSLATSMGLLSIVTGNHPMLSIDMLRPWIVASRAVALLLTMPCIYYQFRRLEE